jgi:hypothetical protein
MRNSAIGLGASVVISDTPPKMNSRIRATGILYDLATSEWPNSWSTTLTNSMMVVAAATPQYSAWDQFLNSAGKYDLARSQVISTKTRNQE